jgi:hypothetical protein
VRALPLKVTSPLAMNVPRLRWVIESADTVTSSTVIDSASVILAEA